mgnify:CR=1 FL=1
MVGFLVSTHSNLCYGFRDAAAMIGCSYENVDYLSLTEEGIDIFEERMNQKVREMHEKYEHLIVLTDLMSATPYNVASRVIYHQGYEDDYVVAGTNLGLFMELVIASQFEDDVKELAEKAEPTGKDSVCLVHPFSYYAAEEDTEEEEDF